MSKVGIVLEGGGMRGIYTAGVLDYFMERNFYSDGIIGVSAGACHACSYTSKQIKRSYLINTKYLKDKRYMSFSSLMKTGDFFGAKFIYDTIPNELHLYDYDAHNANKTRLYAVCSNLESGEAEYIECKDISKDVEYIRASASLPLLSNIVEIDKMKLLDGGCCDSIPLKQFQKIGYDKNIVILTQCKEYRKGKSRLIPLLKKRYHNYPKFVKALVNRHNEYNACVDEIAKLQGEKAIFVIQPKEEVNISRLEKDVNKLRDLYDKGYNDAKASFDEMKSYLNQ